MRIGARAQQQKRRRTRGPRPHRRAENSSRSNRGPQQIRLEKFSYEIRHGHGAPANQPHHFFFSESAHFAPNLQQLPDIFLRRFINLRRSQRQHLRDDFAGTRQTFFQFQIIRRIALREFLNLSRRGVSI